MNDKETIEIASLNPRDLMEGHIVATGKRELSTGAHWFRDYQALSVIRSVKKA